MATPFDPLLYKLPLTWVSVVPETIDPVTGTIVPGSETRSSLKAVLHDTLPVKRNGVTDQNWSSRGEFIEGYRSIHTEQKLTLGDHIEITERDGTVSLWQVETQFSSYETLSKMLGISWYSFAIHLVSSSATGPAPAVIDSIVPEATFNPTTNHWTLISGSVVFSDSKSLIDHEQDLSNPAIDDWNL